MQDSKNTLNEQELELYSRQLLVKGWGIKQQLALKNSCILMNSSNEIAARYLIGAGIGNLIIRDKELYDKIKDFRLNTNLELLDKALSKNITNKIASFDLEINESDKNKHEIYDGIALALNAIKTIAKFI